MKSSCNIIKMTFISNEQYFILPSYVAISDSQEPNEIIENQKINRDIEYEKAIKDAKETCNKIISRANKKANEIISEATIKSQNEFEESKGIGYQEGYKKGYSEGYNRGIDESKNDSKKIIDDANEYLYSAKKETDEYLNNFKNEIVELAVEISRKILQTDLSINQEAVFKIAEKVISSAVDRKQIILRVNPEDYKILKNRKDELTIYVDKSDDLFLVADDRVIKGCIKAETQSGFIDGDIETQLNTILKTLTGEN